MTTVEEIYEKCLWGKEKPFTPVEQLGGREFKRGSSVIKTFVGKDSQGHFYDGNPLIFEEYNPKGELIFRNRLYQNGRAV